MGTESPSALGRFLEFHGSGGWGKTKRASERAGPSSDCGERGEKPMATCSARSIVSFSR
jgi:hypothetical protein